MRGWKLLLGTLLCFGAIAQESSSFKIVQYNVLNYRNHFNECNLQTNDPKVKERAMRTLFEYLDADLINLNELSGTTGTADSLWLNVFDTSVYALSSFGGSSYLANAVIYKKEKFVFYSHDLISKDLNGKDLNGKDLVRSIDHFIFYFNFADHLEAKDSLFIDIFSAHLKAGSDSLDRAERTLACEALIAHHQMHSSQGHSMIMGDLNLSTASSEAYRLLDAYYSDPLAQEGDWHDRAVFAQTHTQSTHDTDSNPCFISGGLDDRFDMILLQDKTLSGTTALRYSVDSYFAVGNDGTVFNNSILASAAAVPTGVLEALHRSSDHLPVQLTLDVVQWAANVPVGQDQQTVKVHQRGHQLYLTAASPVIVTSELLDVSGRILRSESIPFSSNQLYVLSMEGLNAGAYWLRLRHNGLNSLHKIHLLND